MTAKTAGDLSRFDEGSSDEDDFIARVRASEAEAAAAVDTFDGDDAQGATGGGRNDAANDEDASRGASKRARAKEKKRKAKAERAKRRKAEEAQIRAKRAAGEDEEEGEGGRATTTASDEGGE